MKATVKGPHFVRQQLGSHKYTNSCKISNIFAFGALGFQQFSFPTKVKRFLLLHGGPERSPYTEERPQDKYLRFQGAGFPAIIAVDENQRVAHGGPKRAQSIAEHTWTPQDAARMSKQESN